MGLEGLTLEVSVGGEATIRYVAEKGDPENTSWDWPLREGHFCQYERGTKGRIGAHAGRFRGIPLFL